jgi:hypothetical protein
MARIFVSTILDCPPEKAWAEVQKPTLLRYVIYPMARVVSVDPEGFPARWAAQTTYRCKCFIFGWVPLGIRILRIERVDEETFEIQSREFDPLVRRWDHLITIRPYGDDQTLYADQIDVDAGILTFAVWLWANWFYRHRQWRWRRLANRLARAHVAESSIG